MFCYFRLNTSKAPTLHKTNFRARKVGVILQIVSAALAIIISLMNAASYISRERNSQAANNRSDLIARSQTTPDEGKQTSEKSDEIVATQESEEEPATQRSYPPSKVQNGTRRKSSQHVGAPNKRFQFRDNFPAPQVNPSWSAAVAMAPPDSRLCLLNGTPFLENIDGTVSYVQKTSGWILVDKVLRKCPTALNSMNISSLRE